MASNKLLTERVTEAPETRESSLSSSQPTPPHILPVLEALSLARQEVDPKKPQRKLPVQLKPPGSGGLSVGAARVKVLPMERVHLWAG